MTERDNTTRGARAALLKLVLKARRSRTVARTAVLSWRDAYAVSDTSSTVMVDAIDLATDHGMRIWDAVMYRWPLTPIADWSSRRICKKALPGAV
jgi:predicted nucleic acid-binding protein